MKKVSNMQTASFTGIHEHTGEFLVGMADMKVVIFLKYYFFNFPD